MRLERAVQARAWVGEPGRGTSRVHREDLQRWIISIGYAVRDPTMLSTGSSRDLLCTLDAITGIQFDQVMYDVTIEGVRSRKLPPVASDVMPGVKWGAFDELYTPAFWAGRAWQFETDNFLDRYRLGPTLAHEVAACVLGGYGIPAEVGLAAYQRLRDAGILDRTTDADELARLLTSPLVVRGRHVRYRFAQRKALHLADALDRIARADVDQLDDRALRTFLVTLPGIGPKTASWITRNWRGSDAVAILDIHICRACVLAKVFPVSADPARQYFDLENRFLAFAIAIGVRASILDNLMWQTMRGLGTNVHQSLREASAALSDDRGAHATQRRRTKHARNDVVTEQPEQAEA